MEKKQLPILFATPYECCGCTACSSACPVNAIQMTADEEGFLYPVVDEKICIGCGKCEQVCQLKNDEGRSDPLFIYAAKNIDLDSRMHSSSGGMFRLLAEYMETQGGVIYGAAFDDAFRVCHQRAVCRSEWEKFCVSKYVQSDMGDCYSMVKKDLEDGLPVLFSGTPCQVEGLNRFLVDVDTDKLLTCDMICYGVPSPKIWREWLEQIRKETGKRVNAICFRDKDTTGWHRSSLSLYGEDSNLLFTGTHSENTYSKMFFHNLIVRPACHKCHYSNFYRSADVTLGDFWGVEKQFPLFDDDKGVSLVFLNSDKGVAAWNSVRSNTEGFEVEKKQCEQPSLLHPAKEAKGRALFWKVYKQYGLKAALKLFKLVRLSAIEKVFINASRFLLRLAGEL